jgi:hypothetical protein
MLSSVRSGNRRRMYMLYSSLVYGHDDGLTETSCLQLVGALWKQWHLVAAGEVQRNLCLCSVC